MRSGLIWWSQIGSSLKFVARVTDMLRDSRSTVLQLSPTFPWKNDFYQAVDIKRTAFGGERRLVRLPWDEGVQPGEFVLTELCSPDVRAEYWPGQSHAEYLAAQDDIELCDCYVWVTGIRRKVDLQKWTEFVRQYEHYADGQAQHAVFVLEYENDAVDAHGMEVLVHTVENHDCRVFCLEAAADLRNTELREYQAELALCIGGNHPEFCAALLETGEALLHDPVGTAQQIIETSGMRFPDRAEPQLNAAAWKAALVLLFPVIESYRMEFIDRNINLLAQCLPKEFPYGNGNTITVTDPLELDIGQTGYLASDPTKPFPSEEAAGIRICCRVRNLLAHRNKPVPYEDVCKVLSL